MAKTIYAWHRHHMRAVLINAKIYFRTTYLRLNLTLPPLCFFSKGWRNQKTLTGWPAKMLSLGMFQLQVSHHESTVTISKIIRMVDYIVGCNKHYILKGLLLVLKFNSDKTFFFLSRKGVFFFFFMCGHLVCSSLAEVSLHHCRLFFKFPLLIEMISYQVLLRMRTTPCAYKEKTARTWIMRPLTPNTTARLVFSLACPFEHHSLFLLHYTFASSVVLPHFLLQTFDEEWRGSGVHSKRHKDLPVSVFESWWLLADEKDFPAWM